LKVVKPGIPVTIKGDCAGRRLEAGKYLIRIDNCEFVSTTGPSPSVPRLAPADLAREFEEDLRPYYFPPPAARDPAAPALTVTQLGKEWKADDKALVKYRNRVLTVTGRLAKKTPGQLILESPETDKPLLVSCRFGRAVWIAWRTSPRTPSQASAPGWKARGRSGSTTAGWTPLGCRSRGRA
jgi:hypothetical protein